MLLRFICATGFQVVLGSIFEPVEALLAAAESIPALWRSCMSYTQSQLHPHNAWIPFNSFVNALTSPQVVEIHLQMYLMMKSSSPVWRFVEKVMLEWGEGEKGTTGFLSNQHLCSHCPVRHAFWSLIHPARELKAQIPWIQGITTKHWFAFPSQLLLLKWSQNYFQGKSKAALTNISKGPKKS